MEKIGKIDYNSPVNIFKDNIIVKSILVIFGATVIAAVLLCLVYIIPDKAIEPSVESLRETIDRECPRWTDERFFSYAYGSKNMPDTFIYNLSYRKGESILSAAMGGMTNPDSGDERYWDGFMVIVRPLMVLFSYGQLRFIFLCAECLLLWYVITMINERLDKYISLALVTGLMFTNFIVNLFGLMISFIFLIMLSFMAYFLKTWSFDTDWKKLYFIFMLDGILTTYLDRYTASLLTLEMPLLIIILMNMRERGKQAFKKNIRLTVSGILGWGIGWSFFWFNKWVIATPVLKRNILLSAFRQAHMRGTVNARSVYGDVSGYTGGRFYTLLKNICSLIPTHGENLIPAAVTGLIVLILMAVYLMRVRGYIADIKQYIPVFILALMPYVYYFILSNLCQIHATFYMYRMQLTTIVAILAVYFDAVKNGKARSREL